MRACFDQLRIAIMLLTRLPVGRISGEVPSLNAARWAFPVVGILVGSIVWAVHAGALMLGAAPALAALAGLATVALLTGALHMDGLADYADGIGGGRDKEHRLLIMRDSTIGSYGAAALFLCLGTWVAALSDLGAQAGLAAFVLIGVSSRLMMVAQLEFLPPARSDGMGVLATGSSAPLALGIGASLALLSASVLGGAGFAALGVIILIAAGLGWHAKHRIGGHTGDVLGATQLICETLGWAVLSVAIGAA